ncbi:hypothetical protein [Streptomyces lavendulae]|uniref:hypothetical protein n=1 Tax=Streptomyces lavendulae TaxID=1914 RepID=UPI002552C0DE|nr:hypothetical protein [Streptomyces lavendulae]
MNDDHPRSAGPEVPMRVVTAAPPPPVALDATLAREKLREYRVACESRNSLIREAKQAGLSEVEIAELSGHSRNTVRNVIKQSA